VLRQPGADRLATMLYFLNDGFGGGSTNFPLASTRSD
jgi:hypothetical protein